MSRSARDPNTSKSQNYDLPFKVGDRMTRGRFHSLYEQLGDSSSAELVDGAVYVREPLKFDHGDIDIVLSTLLGTYMTRTPGVRAESNATVLLSDRDEVQPDLHMRIEPSCGGQSRYTKDRYIEGAPELVIEIANTSKAIDLGIKQKRYREAGVLEYLVVCLEPQQLHWFEPRRGSKLLSAEGEIIRSSVFPGLWFHAFHLLRGRLSEALSLLEQGLATSEHRQFVERLKFFADGSD